MSLSEIQGEISRRLDGSCKKIQAVKRLEAFLLAMVHALWIAVLFAAAWCLLRLALYLASIPHNLLSNDFLFCLGAGLMVPLAVAFFRSMRFRTSLCEAAERLDLGAGAHNRVAIALALAKEGIDAPFARAAIRDGLAELERIEDSKPYWAPLPLRARQKAGLAIAALALSGLAGLWGVPPIQPIEKKPPLAGAEESVSRDSSLLAERREKQEIEKSEALRGEGEDLDREIIAATFQEARTSPGIRAGPSKDSSGGGGRAGGRLKQGSAAARGRSSNSSGPLNLASAEEPGLKPARKPKPARKRRISEEGEMIGSSALARGAPGGRGNRPSEQAESQRIRTRTDASEEEGDSGEVEEEQEGSRQRGGIQPFLKDRSEPPSRELGISEAQGRQGSGRGGPTPPKKSRGTASLVLGIPTPDFVKGRLGPGLSKVTHERIDPSAMPADASAPRPAAPGSLRENPLDKFVIPDSFVKLVRDYFIALHARREKNEQAGTGTVQGEQGR